MYVLHYAPDNASLIVRLALEELGVPYRADLVDRAARAQDSPGYLRLSPTGLIPALVTPQGPIFETGAILLWLADRHGGLAPAPEDADRGDFLKWLFFVSNTLHADMRMLFHPERYAGRDTGAFRRRTESRVIRHLGLIETMLASRPAWCRPEAPGAMGCYLGPLLRWLALYPEDRPLRPDITAFPALHALLLALDGRPAAEAAIAAEGLGPAPFSNAAHACPPEGSAV